MEGGVETTPDPQSGAGAADTNTEAGATGRSGENQQVGVFMSSWKLCLLLRLLTTLYLCLFIVRLQHEVSLLQQQLCESRELIHSLQSELQVYDRVCSGTKANKGQKFNWAFTILDILFLYRKTL